MAKVPPPYKWHGGKEYLAAWIVGNFPAHLHYVEPYFGGGAVFRRRPVTDWAAATCEKCGSRTVSTHADGKPGHYKCAACSHDWTLPAGRRGCSEVIGDANRWVSNFWKVLRNPELFAELQRLLAATPISQDSFEGAQSNLAMSVGKLDPQGDAKAAWWFFVQYRQSRQGLGKSFATLSKSRTRGGLQELSNSYWGAVEGLPNWADRMRGVVIFTGDAVELIRREDSPSTFCYLDPPYLRETRGAAGNEYGAYEMSTAQHAELLATLSTAQDATREILRGYVPESEQESWEAIEDGLSFQLSGRFMLSGYNSKLYSQVADANGWSVRSQEIDNKAQAGETKQKKTEVLWMNYDPRT